jgi:hypothetical protein
MKKLLSNRPGRLMPLLVLVCVVVSFLIPADALAIKEIRIGRDRTGGTEGDPLDTNDVGGGGGGSDIHDNTGGTAADDPLEFGFLSYRILLVPEFLDGKIVFRVVLISSRGSVLRPLFLEGPNAP